MSQWGRGQWGRYRWAELLLPWLPVYPAYVSKDPRISSRQPSRYLVEPILFTVGAETVQLDKFLPIFLGRPYKKPWLPNWLGEQRLSVFTEEVRLDKWHHQEPANAPWTYWRRPATQGGSFYSPDDFEAARPVPTIPEMAAAVQTLYPSRLFTHRTFPYGLESFFDIPGVIVGVWREPATTAISSTWTEPASTAITSTWTEPAVSTVTSTWTEPAVTPVRPSPDLGGA